MNFFQSVSKDPGINDFQALRQRRTFGHDPASPNHKQQHLTNNSDSEEIDASISIEDQRKWEEKSSFC